MKSLKETLRKFSLLLNRRDKIYLLILLIFSIFISFMETAGVAVILPFIKLSADFSVIHKNRYFQLIYNFFHFGNDVNFVIVFGLSLILFYLFRASINMFYYYILSRFSFSRYYVVSSRLFARYLGMSYRYFIERNSSELIKMIVNEAMNFTNIIFALLFMLSELFIIIFIYSIFIYVSWKATLFITVLLALNGTILVLTVSRVIKSQGVKREEIQRKFFAILNSSFGNFKMIKIGGKEDMIKSEFNRYSYGYANAYAINQTLGYFPRLFLETVSFGLVIVMVIYLIFRYQTNISSMFGMISMFVLGLYRLMPSVNRIFVNYNFILFNYRALDLVYNDLIYEVERLSCKKIEFNKKIELEDITFHYIDGKDILKNINLVINKGDKVAFTGESGCGKSTLVDIIIGLFRPQGGKIKIDGEVLTEENVRSWRKKIGYIPQSIYLFDGTVAENVALGEEIDERKMVDVLKKANIWDFLKNYHRGVNTRVGEGGIKLSGGQKQRIAIARALYNDPEILVLDEATSALDNDTEEKIMDEIYNISENKTLIIVAHRISTTERCEKIYLIEDGKLHRVK